MIIFDEQRKIFKIHTQNTTYAMQILHGKYVAHLYYGKRMDDIPDFKKTTASFTPYYKEENECFSFGWTATELSFFGSNDAKDTALKIQNGNGDSSTLFHYKAYRIFKGRIEFDDMPYSRGGEETLELVYEDETSNCTLYSYYTVFPNSDVITRYLRVENNGEHAVLLQRAIACQLDLPENQYETVYLCGKYFNERNIVSTPTHIGVQGIYSQRGHSSHHFNPFMAIKTAQTTEYFGDAYAMEFVYSGDFTAQAEQSFEGSLRLLMGLNKDTFSWRLEKGEGFTTPETILTYSGQGTNKLTQNLHEHIRTHIIPEKFANTPRPIVINTWEAMGMKIHEDGILQYARSAKELGIDTVVVDDGWFGKRNNDDCSLGDWQVDLHKFPNGLAAFSNKIHEMGLKLGFWIEPEMINADSRLYEKHPEWVLQCKDRTPSLGRTQYALDLTNDEAIDFVVNELKETFKDVQLDYIKWDFNRSLAEVGSLCLPPERQCEAKHRFVLGSYKMHAALIKAFPDVLFEGCCGGGGRFDCGILFYCPQIWTSDNTDPVARIDIQKGTAFAYPLSTISAHVSNSKFNTLESERDYAFRFNVAALGTLGYEMDITKLSVENRQIIKEQIQTYKRIQPLILSGDCYRLNDNSAGEYGVCIVSKDKKRFVAIYVNDGTSKRERMYLQGLQTDAWYRDEKGREYSGKTAMGLGIEIDNFNKAQYFLLEGNIRE